MDMHDAGRNSAAILGGKKTRCEYREQYKICQL